MSCTCQFLFVSVCREFALSRLFAIHPSEACLYRRELASPVICPRCRQSDQVWSCPELQQVSVPIHCHWGTLRAWHSESWTVRIKVKLIDDTCRNRLRIELVIRLHKRPNHRPNLTRESLLFLSLSLIGATLLLTCLWAQAVLSPLLVCFWASESFEQCFNSHFGVLESRLDYKIPIKYLRFLSNSG